MIKYVLRCAKGHSFEAWFASSAAFDALKAAGQLECNQCDSNDIRKDIMAPAISRGQKDPANAEPRDDQTADVDANVDDADSHPLPAPVPAPANPVGRDAVRRAAYVAMARKVHDYVQQHFEQVGPRFADEARSIHYGDSEPRNIAGEATADEAQELQDEGIEVGVLPPLPKLDG